MKKQRTGFTLAEVLIVLAIIGVIAAIVIPALINNYQEQVTKSKLRAGYSILSQATSKMAFDNGGNLVGTFSNTVDVKNNYAKYLSVTKNCDSGNGTCWPSKVLYQDGTVNAWWGNEADLPSLALNNGFSVGVKKSILSTSCNTNNSGDFQTSNVCYFLYLDINGIKGDKTWGKDVFGFWVLGNGKVVPAGTSQDIYIDQKCNVTKWWGGECTAYYLQQ